MRKENVFLVSTCIAATANTPSTLEQIVICSTTQESMHEYVERAFPQRKILGVASMVELEATLKAIRSALECKPDAYPVFVDPRMKNPSTPRQR